MRSRGRIASSGQRNSRPRSHSMCDVHNGIGCLVTPRRKPPSISYKIWTPGITLISRPSVSSSNGEPLARMLTRRNRVTLFIDSAWMWRPASFKGRAKRFARSDTSRSGDAIGSDKGPFSELPVAAARSPDLDSFRDAVDRGSPSLSDMLPESQRARSHRSTRGTAKAPAIGTPRASTAAIANPGTDSVGSTAIGELSPSKNGRRRYRRSAIRGTSGAPRTGHRREAVRACCRRADIPAESP